MSRWGLPIVNALDDQEHSCQILADLMTLRESLGQDLRSPRITYTWAYSPRQKTPGVLHSSMLAAAMLGMRATFAYPPGFAPDQRYAADARRIAQETGGSVEFTHDLEDATRGSDAVYVLSWKSFELEGQDELQARARYADRWRVTEPLMAIAGKNSIFLDCMPTVRGDEVDAEVKDGARSVIYQQAENRLHVQKALLTDMLTGNARKAA